MHRRAILGLPLATLLPAVGLAEQPRAPLPKVGSDEDREGRTRSIGLSDSRYKVLTRDSGGDLFVLEQRNHQKGGPSRHLHHHEDELFFCLAGEYVVEVGAERVRLAPGDCVLGPRGIPHAWAYAGTTPGRLLITFAPAGKMEAFFAARSAHGLKPGQYAAGQEDAAFMREYGMELIGPPIPVSSL